MNRSYSSCLNLCLPGAKSGAWWWTQKKTQVVHFWPARKSRPRFEFHFGGDTLLHYLGVYLDEHLSVKKTAIALLEVASRALGAIRYRLRFFKECMLSTFTALYSSCVFPILLRVPSLAFTALLQLTCCMWYWLDLMSCSTQGISYKAPEETHYIICIKSSQWGFSLGLALLM